MEECRKTWKNSLAASPIVLTYCDQKCLLHMCAGPVVVWQPNTSSTGAGGRYLIRKQQLDLHKITTPPVGGPHA